MGVLSIDGRCRALLYSGHHGIFFRSIVFALVISFGIGVVALILGVLLVIDTSIVGSIAVSLWSYPTMHGAAGATILIFPFLALFLGGGCIIGTVLGIIGEIMAIMYV